MRVLLYPFFSQQDKRTGKFRLTSDAGVKLYAYIAQQLAEAHSVSFVLPPVPQCADSLALQHCVLRPSWMHPSNFDRRLQWDPVWLRRIAETFDIVLCQHECLAYPLRSFSSKLKLVTEGGVLPAKVWGETRELIELCWKASDLVHCNTRQIEEQARRYARTSLWQFAYDDSIAVPRGLRRDIDVLFNSRASATEYTSHSLFARALDDSAYRVLMTDPTGYLHANGGCRSEWLQDELDSEAYADVLHRSRTVVSLVTNGCSGFAFREAIAAGAVPVAFRLPEYVDLLGPGWPYYAEEQTEESVRSAVDRAVAQGWDGVPAAAFNTMHEALARCSYSAAWRAARRDLEELCAH